MCVPGDRAFGPRTRAAASDHVDLMPECGKPFGDGLHVHGAAEGARNVLVERHVQQPHVRPGCEPTSSCRRVRLSDQSEERT